MHDSSHQAGDVPLVLFLHVDGQHLHTLLLHLGHLENVVLNKMIKNLGLLINDFKNKMLIFCHLLNGEINPRVHLNEHISVEPRAHCYKSN